MFLLIAATSRRQQPLGVVADRCANCQAVRPFDITRYTEPASSRSKYARKRCWDCGETTSCDEHKYDCFATTETAERWTLGKLLERTHEELAHDLVEVGEPVEEVEVAQLRRAPVPVVRRQSTWETLRGLFIDIPWQLFWTVAVGVAVLFCVALCAEGKLWFGTRLLPLVYVAGVAVSVLLAMVRRVVRRHAQFVEEYRGAARRAPSRRAWAVGFGTLILGSVASLSAEAWRVSHRWPANLNTDSIAVAPGASTKVHLSKTLRSVKGYWSATAIVTWLNPTSNVPVNLEADASHQTWGDRIPLGQHDSDSEEASLWVVTRLPANSQPGIARLRVRLEPTYPVKRADGRYDDVRTEVTEEVELSIAPDRAATDEYYTAAWVGVAVSVIFAGGAALLISYYEIHSILSRVGSSK